MYRKYEKEYNPKIDYKMLFSINPLFNLEENFNEIKKVFNGKEKAVSKQAKMFEKLKEIFDYLKKTSVETLKEIDIQEILKKLKIKNINNERIVSLLKTLKSKENTDTITFSAKVFAFIVKNEIFKEISLEIGLLFMNAILYYYHYIPMIIFRNNFNYFKDLIKDNVTIESLVEILSNLKDVSIRYSEKYEETTKENIVDVIKKNKQELKDRYHIKKIWLYGSFVRDDSTSYSDIDLFVEMEEIQMEELRKYLLEKFKRPVDIQIEGSYNPSFAMYPALKERELILDVSE